MSVTDLGYDQYFDKSVVSKTETVSSLDADVLWEGIGGNQVLSDGNISSSDGSMNMNLSSSQFSISDGVTDRTVMGKFPDGTYGLRITDRNGNTMFNISGEGNVIQSANGKIKIDLDNNQIIISDENNERILIGEDQSGF